MKYIITLLLAVSGVLAFAQQSTTPQNPTTQPQATTVAGTDDGKKESREVKREEREKERAAKAAAYTKFVDSLVMSHSFLFLPSTFQMEPAGRQRQIPNPSFRVDVYPESVDIMLPYFVGVVPPYAISVLNYTVSDPDKMLYKQTEHGWEVSFESSLYGSNNYKFKFVIYSTTGEINLTLDSDMFSTVTYSGSIVAHN